MQDDKPIKRETRKVPLNDACPCGSGKKYKYCCGADLYKDKLKQPHNPSTTGGKSKFTSGYQYREYKKNLQKLNSIIGKDTSFKINDLYELAVYITYMDKNVKDISLRDEAYSLYKEKNRKKLDEIFAAFSIRHSSLTHKQKENNPKLKYIILLSNFAHGEVFGDGTYENRKSYERTVNYAKEELYDILSDLSKSKPEEVLGYHKKEPSKNESSSKKTEKKEEQKFDYDRDSKVSNDIIYKIVEEKMVEKINKNGFKILKNYEGMFFSLDDLGDAGKINDYIVKNKLGFTIDGFRRKYEQTYKERVSLFKEIYDRRTAHTVYKLFKKKKKEKAKFLIKEELDPIYEYIKVRYIDESKRGYAYDFVYEILKKVYSNTFEN